MKFKVLKTIIPITIFLIIISIFSSSIANAASLNITTDKEKIGKGEDVIVKVSTDKKIETTTFYLKYDSKTMEFVESNTSNLSVKDYAADGTLRVAYASISQQGTKNLEFKFQAKNDDNVKQSADLEISNFTLRFVNDSKVYKMTNLDDSTFKTTVKIQKPFKLTAKAIIPIALCIAIMIIFIILKTVFRRNTFSWKRKI